MDAQPATPPPATIDPATLTANERFLLNLFRSVATLPQDAQPGAADPTPTPLNAEQREVLRAECESVAKQDGYPKAVIIAGYLLYSGQVDYDVSTASGLDRYSMLVSIIVEAMLNLDN